MKLIILLGLLVLIPMVTATTNETNITIQEPLFTIITIPDTQEYIVNEERFKNLNDTVNWIKNQSVDLVFHVGDFGRVSTDETYSKYKILNEMNKTLITVMGDEDIPRQYYSLFNDTNISTFNISENLTFGIVTIFNNETDKIINESKDTIWIYLTHGHKIQEIESKNIFLRQIGHVGYSQKLIDDTYYIATGHWEKDILLQRYDFFDNYVNSEVFSIYESFIKFNMTYNPKSIDYEYGKPVPKPPVVYSGGGGGGGSGEKKLTIKYEYLPQQKIRLRP